jgi:hypothetical protein
MGDLPAKVSWYMKWRTTIWGAVWFVVGLCGGNADRIQDYVPTLQYQQTETQLKTKEYNDLLAKLKQIKSELGQSEDGE